MPLQKGHWESNNSITPNPLHTEHFFLVSNVNYQFKWVKIPMTKIFSNTITKRNPVKLILYSQTEM